MSLLPEKILQEFEEMAKKYKIRGKKKEQLLKKLEEKYLNSLIDPQEPIGIITAQSFGEPATQMLLNAFHFAGVSELQLVTGLPRLIEILNAKKKPTIPSMTIYLEKNDEKLAEELVNKLIEVKLSDIAKSISIDVINKRIIIELDQQLVKEKDITKKDLEKAFKSAKLKAKIENNTITIEAGNKRPKELYLLKNKIKDLHIKGVKGIKYAMITRENDELVIKTFGSNLKEVLKMKGIDKTRTTTNDIHEIAKVLGIDAAREAIIEEIQKVLEEQGLEIDVRYLLLIADVMTYYGEVLGFTRHGLMERKPSPLERATFEVPFKNLADAALLGEKDDLRAVIVNVLINQPAPMGTGRIKLVFDEKKFEELKKKLGK
ncbi:NEQ427 [Nanoarchaeum equitans Kin4-M]|uniref:DNA-directed RNA polymerase subunit Rpo1C n=1 Tax=Nanoarchaeum equitans (strain Kin4-M) TaxID=228908 RepID=Q74MX8_NANEQ|nr:NEQ427 [Nanoarchaeum equitans Kin4-M]